MALQVVAAAPEDAPGVPVAEPVPGPASASSSIGLSCVLVMYVGLAREQPSTELPAMKNPTTIARLVLTIATSAEASSEVRATARLITICLF